MDNTTSPTTAPVPTAVQIPPPPNYATSGKIMLTCVVVLVTLIILMLILHIYIRWHLHQRRNQNRRQYHRRLHNLNFVSDTTLPNNSQRGLDPSILVSLPVFIYKIPDEVVECAVCLFEFEEGEKGRVLPACKHRFHVECIDMWFGSHSTCPMCRSAVELIEEDKDPGESSASSSRQLESSNLGRRVEESKSVVGRRMLSFSRIILARDSWCDQGRSGAAAAGDLERGEALGDGEV